MFPVRYEPNFYILFRINLVLKVLIVILLELCSHNVIVRHIYYSYYISSKMSGSYIFLILLLCKVLSDYIQISFTDLWYWFFKFYIRIATGCKWTFPEFRSILPTEKKIEIIKTNIHKYSFVYFCVDSWSLPKDGKIFWLDIRIICVDKIYGTHMLMDVTFYIWNSCIHPLRM
jgi:hypothetical protein